MTRLISEARYTLAAASITVCDWIAYRIWLKKDIDEAGSRTRRRALRLRYPATVIAR